MIFLPPGEPGASAPTPMLNPSGAAPAPGAGEPKRTPPGAGAPKVAVEPGPVLGVDPKPCAGVEVGAPNWNGALPVLAVLAGAPNWKPGASPVGVDEPEVAPKLKVGAEEELGLELLPALTVFEPKLNPPDAGAGAPKPVDGAAVEPKPVPVGGVPNPPVAGAAEELPNCKEGLGAELAAELEAEPNPEPVPKPVVGEVTPKPVLAVVVVGDVTGAPKPVGADEFEVEPKPVEGAEVFEPKLKPEDGASVLDVFPKPNGLAVSPLGLAPKPALGPGAGLLPNECDEVEAGAGGASAFFSPPKEKFMLPEPKPEPAAGVDDCAPKENAGLSPLAAPVGPGADGAAANENGLGASVVLSAGAGVEPLEPKEKGALVSAGLSAAGAEGAPNEKGALAGWAGLSAGAADGAPKLNSALGLSVGLFAAGAAGAEGAPNENGAFAACVGLSAGADGAPNENGALGASAALSAARVAGAPEGNGLGSAGFSTDLAPKSNAWGMLSGLSVGLSVVVDGAPKENGALGVSVGAGVTGLPNCTVSSSAAPSSRGLTENGAGLAAFSVDFSADSMLPKSKTGALGGGAVGVVVPPKKLGIPPEGGVEGLPRPRPEALTGLFGGAKKSEVEPAAPGGVRPGVDAAEPESE